MKSCIAFALLLFALQTGFAQRQPPEELRPVIDQLDKLATEL